MDMDGTWFMKKVIVTTILNGKLMVGYFVFTMSSKKKRCGPGKQDFQVGFWNCNTHWPDGKNPLLLVGGVVIIPRSTKYQDRGRLEGVKESMGTLNAMTVVVTVRTVAMAICGQQFSKP